MGTQATQQLCRLSCGADASRFPNLALAAALSVEVIQEAGETIFVPRFARSCKLTWCLTMILSTYYPEFRV